MVNKEATLEVAEKALDILEDQIDTTVDAAHDVQAIVVNNPVVLAGVAVVAGLVGAGIAWKVAETRLATKYEEIAQFEISEAKQYYRTLNKEGVTPEQLVAEKNIPVDLGYIPQPPVQSESDLVAQVQSQEVAAGERDKVDDRVEEVMSTNEQSTRTVFRNDNGPWNQELEEEKRMAGDGSPYIISKEEFMENQPEYDQVQLTYFEGDDVLADDHGMPSPDPEGTVGEDNLVRFGYGSEDPNIVYVRNPRAELDFEIARSVGKYGSEVAGFSDAELTHSEERMPRRFRRFDE